MKKESIFATKQYSPTDGEGGALETDTSKEAAEETTDDSAAETDDDADADLDEETDEAASESPDDYETTDKSEGGVN
jgi:hypothetical protein